MRAQMYRKLVTCHLKLVDQDMPVGASNVRNRRRRGRKQLTGPADAMQRQQTTVSRYVYACIS